MRVLLLFDLPHWTGLGEYALQMYQLMSQNIEDVRLVYVGAVADYHSFYSNLPYLKRTRVWALRPLTIRKNYQKILNDPEFKNYIIHYLGYDVSALKTRPGVLTVHDVLRENIRDKIHLLKQLKIKELIVSIYRNRQIQQTIKLCPIAPVVVSISKKTANELKNVSEKDSITIYHWTSLSRFHKRNPTEVLPVVNLQPDFKYLLAVGNNRPNKRIDLLRKFSSYLPPGFKLIKIGAPIESDKVINVGTVDDNTYPLYFNCSECYVHLSEDEGFGRPLIEAISSEIPIVCRVNAINEELLGDSAFYLGEHFTLDDVSNLIEKLTNTKTLEMTRSKIVSRQILFDPDVALKQYLSIYSDVSQDHEFRSDRININ